MLVPAFPVLPRRILGGVVGAAFSVVLSSEAAVAFSPCPPSSQAGISVGGLPYWGEIPAGAAAVVGCPLGWVGEDGVCSDD